MDDEPFPGIVEVQFIDATGRCRSLIDKCAIFARLDELAPDSTYPVEVTVACVIECDAVGTVDDEIVTVSTSPDSVATMDGQDTFTVRRSQLLP
ncbi:hypothetical protein [Streptomyces sp. NPDC056452]|uniref:hypothetical protein n=1 Tax=Streptomyces sp. NPDC056452 TaxID=3345821 RepID=UPI0036CFBD87